LVPEKSEVTYYDGAVEGAVKLAGLLVVHAVARLVQVQYRWVGVWRALSSGYGVETVEAPIVDPRHNEGAIDYGKAKAERRFAYLDAQLDGRETVLEQFSVADACLVTILSWARPVGIDLWRWPNVKSYAARMRRRPSVSRAFDEELVLYERVVCTENLIRVDDVMESPKLAE
jgi:glutathione S-transferase